jgi:hypothetical protein
MFNTIFMVELLQAKALKIVAFLSLAFSVFRAVAKSSIHMW